MIYPLGKKPVHPYGTVYFDYATGMMSIRLHRLEEALMTLPQHIHLQLPAWFCDFQQQAARHRYPDDDSAMQLVLELTRLNVQNGGGPFGAAILAGGQLVSLGVNRVVPDRSSLWHAEMVAIGLAHEASGTHQLGTRSLVLVTSCEPCCMCLGAILWSGISDVVSSARDADAREVGFDEGPKPKDWLACCNERGIAVRPDVQRRAARAILREYVRNGGLIYNA